MRPSSKKKGCDVAPPFRSAIICCSTFSDGDRPYRPYRHGRGRHACHALCRFHEFRVCHCHGRDLHDRGSHVPRHVRELRVRDLLPWHAPHGALHDVPLWHAPHGALLGVPHSVHERGTRLRVHGFHAPWHNDAQDSNGQYKDGDIRGG